MNNRPDKNQIIQLFLKIVELFKDWGNLDILTELNILPQVIELADNPNCDIICLAQRIIGNYAMNNNNIYTQMIIDFNGF